MKLLYAFPEPLPLPRARGVQVAHAVASLAAQGVAVDLAWVPVAGRSPLEPLGLNSLPLLQGEGRGGDGANGRGTLANPSPLPTSPLEGGGDDVPGLPGVRLLPLSRGWPAPLNQVPPFARWHSVRFFSHRLLREIAARHPDALYVRHLKLAALLSRRRDLPPLIYEAHEVFGDTASPRRRERIVAMEGQVIRHAAAVVCNSRATAERLSALYGAPARLLVLPNGVAPPPTLPAKPWPECKKHVVYAGSFFGWKGVADLVAAAAELDGFRITLIGGEAEQIERLRRQLPATGAEIELLPRLPHGEVMQHLAAACIAVLPNRPDPDSAFTSPIKLFEYMAAGCAVVAADLPSIREILAPEEAAWFPAGDAKGLAQALKALAGDGARAQAMGENLRRKSADYTWESRARRLKGFIEETLAQK